MERMSKILLIAGLVVMLCAPAMATAQAPQKLAECGRAFERIDGIWDDSWMYAHLEDITLDFRGFDAELSEDVTVAQPYWVELATMTDGDVLYIGVEERWEDLFTLEDGFRSLFCMFFEGGWLCFIGGDFVNGVQPESFVAMQLDSVAFFVPRVYGPQEDWPLGCFGDEIAVDCSPRPELEPAQFVPLEGVTHAFGMEIGDFNSNEADASQGYVMQSHEIAIDLSSSPLTLGESQTSFPAAFAVFAMGPEVWVDEAGSEADLRGLAVEVSGFLHGEWPPDPYVHLMGLWPGGREWGPEGQFAFVDCIAETYEGPPSCDFGVQCLGEIEICGRYEFVPEPGTLLLLGSGLMGLGGYARLRLRKKQ